MQSQPGSTTKTASTADVVAVNNTDEQLRPPTITAATDPLAVPQWLTRVTPQHFYNGGLSGVGHPAHDPSAAAPNSLPDSKNSNSTTTYHIPKIHLAMSNSNTNSPRQRGPGIQFEVMTPSPCSEFDPAPFFHNSRNMTMTSSSRAVGEAEVNDQGEVSDFQMTAAPASGEGASNTSEDEMSKFSKCQKNAANSSRDFVSFKDKIGRVVPLGDPGAFPVATEESLNTLRDEVRTSTMASEVEDLFAMDDDKASSGGGGDIGGSKIQDNALASFRQQQQPVAEHQTSLTQAVLDKGLPDNWFFRGQVKDLPVVTSRPQGAATDVPDGGLATSMDKKIKEMRELNMHMPINL